MSATNADSSPARRRFTKSASSSKARDARPTVGIHMPAGLVSSDDLLVMLQSSERWPLLQKMCRRARHRSTGPVELSVLRGGEARGTDRSRTGGGAEGRQ